MSSYSIIIRCRNEEKHIGRLLSGIQQQTEKEHEVIVVDSGSTDGTLGIVARYPAKVISIKKEDFSFGYSLNVGCAAASGQFLVIASAHVYPVHRDWIEKLLLPFKNDRVGLVYGKQRGNDDTKFSEVQVFRKWFPEESVDDQGHPFCNNANAAVRRDLWERFRYKESLTGLEELAFARQLVGAGYRIAYQADAEVVHVHDETWQALFNRYRREAIALKEILPQEKFGLIDFVSMFSKNAAGDCARAVKSGVLWRNLHSIVAFRLMQFWGTYRGYAQHGTVSRKLKEKFYYPNDAGTSKRDDLEEPPDRPVIDYKKIDAGLIEKDN